MPMIQSSTEIKCFKGLVYFYVVLLSVSDESQLEGVEKHVGTRATHIPKAIGFVLSKNKSQPH
jgi:hypothetical protein